jgi:hypothetical protein
MKPTLCCHVDRVTGGLAVSRLCLKPATHFYLSRDFKFRSAMCDIHKLAEKGWTFKLVSFDEFIVQEIMTS